MVRRKFHPLYGKLVIVSPTGGGANVHKEEGEKKTSDSSTTGRKEN